MFPIARLAGRGALRCFRYAAAWPQTAPPSASSRLTVVSALTMCNRTVEPIGPASIDQKHRLHPPFLALIGFAGLVALMAQPVWCNWVTEQLNIKNGFLEHNSSTALASAKAEFRDCLFHESCIATVAAGLCKDVVQPSVSGSNEGASVAHHGVVSPDVQIFAAAGGLILGLDVHACAAAWDKFDSKSEAECHDKLVIWTLRWVLNPESSNLESRHSLKVAPVKVQLTDGLW